MKKTQLRKGKWSGNTGNLDSLPFDVQERCEELRESKDDWIMSLAADNQMWLVSKHWEDPEHFTIVASLVKYESEEYPNS